MKKTILSKSVLVSFSAAVAAAALVFSPSLRADTVVTIHKSGAVERVSFHGSAEAGMLHRAYRILAFGDHDYKGHRVKAMNAVRAAADLLGEDLRGDDKNREPQVLSDTQLREAEGLITQVLGAAEVKDQKRVVRRLNEAVSQINLALAIR